MGDQIKTFGQAAMVALTGAAESPRHVTGLSLESFAKHIRLWDAMLPKRSGDDIGGQLIVKGFHRMLGHLTETEMGWMTEMVLGECEWFPTVAQCKALMGRKSYENPFYRSSVERIGSDGWWESARLEAAANGRTLADRRTPKAISEA